MSSDACEVEWAASTLRSLDRLPDKAASTCVEFVYGGLAQNPQSAGGPLRFIDEPRKVVAIVAIDHRADVYRPHWFGGGTPTPS